MSQITYKLIISETVTNLKMVVVDQGDKLTMKDQTVHTTVKLVIGNSANSPAAEQTLEDVRFKSNVIEGDIDANGNTMTNLRDAADEGDAVPLRQANELKAQAIAAAADFTTQNRSEVLQEANLYATDGDDAVRTDARDYTDGQINQANLYTESAVSTAVDQLIDSAPVGATTLKHLNDKIVVLQSLVTGDVPDGDAIVNTLTEVLYIFQNFPENVNLLQVLGTKVNASDIINDLNQLVTGKVLDAAQGKVLKDLINTLSTAVDAKEPAISQSGSVGDFWSGTKTWRNFVTDVRAATLGVLAGGEKIVVTAAMTFKQAIENLQAQILAAAPAKQYMVLSAAYAMPAVNALRQMFNTGTNGAGAFAVEANTLYHFRINVSATFSSTSQTMIIGFLGTAGISSIFYTSLANKGVVLGTAVQTAVGNAVTAVTIHSSNTNTAGRFVVEGEFRTSTAGSFIPAFNSNSAASVSIDAGSFVLLEKLGASSTTASADVT